MRIVTGSGRLTISDNPYPIWAFYSVFVLGGFTALGLSLFKSPDLTASVVGSVVGLGNIAGGLYMMKREPASIVELNQTSNQVLVRRWGITGSATSSYPLDALLGAEIETTDHTDGGTVYRPRLRISPSVLVPVSLLWYQKPGPSKNVVAALERFVSERH